MKLRDGLTHPKVAHSVADSDVELALQAITNAIDAMFHAIYGSPLPVASRGLQSKLGFSFDRLRIR